MTKNFIQYIARLLKTSVQIYCLRKTNITDQPKAMSLAEEIAT